MAHAVLDFATEFSKALAMAFWDEEGIVTEAMVTFLFIGDDARDAS